MVFITLKNRLNPNHYEIPVQIIIKNDLTVDPWADVKSGFTWKIIIVLKVRGGHVEYKFS